MNIKRKGFVLVAAFVFSLLSACSSPPEISEMNCQASDVEGEPAFVLVKEETAALGSVPFPEQMTDYHRAALAEYEVTYTDALCTLRVYEDAAIAEAAWKLLCLESQGAETAEAYGEAACGFQNEGIKEVHFRQGTAVVTVREDAGGSHVSAWAEAVNGRLAD